MIKICSKCKEEKEYSNFNKYKSGKNGLKPACKDCHKQYYESNKKALAEKEKQYREANKSAIAEREKQYREANKSAIAERKKQYREANKEAIAEKGRNYVNNKLKTDPIFKFKFNVRCLIRGSFKRGTNQFSKKAKTEQILGCTIEQFREYIAAKFKKGMSFDNHGQWHLDHIVPLSIATTEEEIIKLNHYTNFQPLWAEDNLSKSDKIIETQLILI